MAGGGPYCRSGCRKDTSWPGRAWSSAEDNVYAGWWICVFLLRFWKGFPQRVVRRYKGTIGIGGVRKPPAMSRPMSGVSGVHHVIVKFIQLDARFPRQYAPCTELYESNCSTGTGHVNRGSLAVSVYLVSLGFQARRRCYPAGLLCLLLRILATWLATNCKRLQSFPTEGRDKTNVPAECYFGDHTCTHVGVNCHA